MILILDYGCGNILSLKRALDEIGLKYLVSNVKEEIINADLIILPGVGAFENAIDLLKKKGLFDIILNEVSKQKPLIGICLGMQMLFTKSFEMGEHHGLNLIEGNIEKIDKKSKIKNVKVPHISWSNIIFENKENLKKEQLVLNERSFYFIHSYIAFPLNNKNIMAKCKYYDINFPAIVKKNNVVGFQFHPEKSGMNGLELLKFTIKDLLKV
jgi:imidazole glycerol-phosphate synthase subunit HisH